MQIAIHERYPPVFFSKIFQHALLNPALSKARGNTIPLREWYEVYYLRW
ncbi:hypothetical protein CIT292_06010 [Citrobacter youngae ATCC 29220]|uniref:Uncharacterized protein n=1 Tax=Citrobacter youngae ATCC 29220 TaxID=500640 RepID=D4B6S0_9ENTR|nr:hypothetical protein CIT292_06010 [Citrobacter youngae ATCC 29220]